MPERLASSPFLRLGELEPPIACVRGCLPTRVWHFSVRRQGGPSPADGALPMRALLISVLVTSGCAYTEDQYKTNVVASLCEKIVACDEETTDECLQENDQTGLDLYCPDGATFDPASARACAKAFEAYDPGCDELSVPAECETVCFPDFG